MSKPIEIKVKTLLKILRELPPGVRQFEVPILESANDVFDLLSGNANTNVHTLRFEVRELSTGPQWVLLLPIG